jgi:KaiC
MSKTGIFLTVWILSVHVTIPHCRIIKRAISGKRLANAILSALERTLEFGGTSEKKEPYSNQKKKKKKKNVGSTSKPVRLVIDSMTHTFLLLGERMLIEFVMDLTRILKGLNVTAILALTASSVDQRMLSELGSIVDGNIEMRLKEDANDMTIRSVRVRHLKGVYYDPKRTNFKISSNGTIIFMNAQSSSLRTPAEVTCALCAKPIIGTPFVESDFIFDSKECMEIYHRLEKCIWFKDIGYRIALSGL